MIMRKSQNEKRRDFCGCEYNEFPEVRKTYEFAKEVYIVDSTIRSLQSGVSGGCHSVQDLVEIGKALDVLGVKKQIINLDWKNGIEVCEGLAHENLQCKIVGALSIRQASWEERADVAIRAGVNEICFPSIPDVEHIKRAAYFVQNRGKAISHAFGRSCSLNEVIVMCREGVKYGYESQTFEDSFFGFGINPEAMKYFIKLIKNSVSNCPPLYVHLSNFFGQATMTAVAAIVAGASAADVSMNGIGHHCGHISLPECVMVLEVLYGIRTGINLERLKEVSLLVQERSKIPFPITKPIVGDFAFIIDGALRAMEASIPHEEKVYGFPFQPNAVGNEERVIWSDKTISSTEGIKEKLASMKLTYQEDDIKKIIRRLTEILEDKERYPRWMLNSEFEELCQTVLSNPLPNL